MNRRDLFKMPLLAGAILPKIELQASQNLNVLFVVLDDASRMVLGHPGLNLPNFKRLRRRGMTFSNTFCQAPLCGPSRASLLTGKHPNTTGILDHDRIPFRTHLPDVTTLPQHFRESGYLTSGNGKIFHPIPNDPDWIDSVSWDRYEVRGPVGSPLPEKIPANGFNAIWDWAAIDGAYIDDQVTDASCRFLSRNHSQPFFLGVGLIGAHAPWYVPTAHFNQVTQVVLPQTIPGDLDDVPDIARELAATTGMKHENVLARGVWAGAFRCYLAALLHVDHNLGRLLDTLAASSHSKNTVVVVCGDHGMHCGEKFHWSKFTLWREAVQTPLIISVPGLPGGRMYGFPVANLDIFPTLIDLCGLPPLPGLEGVSLANILSGDECPTDREVSCVYDGHEASISDSWWRIKYLDGTTELYNNHYDPSQWFNLAGKPVYLPWLQ